MQRELGLFRLEKRRLRDHINVNHKSWWGWLNRTQTDSSQWYPATGGNSHTLKYGELHLNITRNSFSHVVVEHWHRFPSEVVEYPALKILKLWPDSVLGHAALNDSSFSRGVDLQSCHPTSSIALFHESEPCFFPMQSTLWMSPNKSKTWKQSPLSFHTYFCLFSLLIFKIVLFVGDSYYESNLLWIKSICFFLSDRLLLLTLQYQQRNI